jgi:hypothetical protein
MKLYYSYLLLFIVLLSCTPTTEKSFQGFDQHYSLSSTAINLSPTYFRKGYQFDIWDDKLIILDGYSTDTLFTVYDLASRQMIKQFGFAGDAPNQLRVPGAFVLDRKRKLLYIEDNGSQNMKSFELNNLLDSGGFEPKTINHPNSLTVVFFFPLPQNQFITRQLDQTDDLLLKYSAEEVIDTIGKQYRTSDPLILGDAFQQYYYIFNKHPSRDLYVSSYFNYDVIQITDAKKNESIIVRGPEKVSYKDLNQEFTAYRWTEVGEEHIYASYIGELASSDFSPSDYPSKINVFDLAGNAIAQLQLDVPIQFFRVDEEKKLIYALADTEVGDFVTFNIPEL